MTIVRFDEVAAQPWRNGGGRTRELLAWPQASGWRVRVSVAEVDADGPFSAFPDVQRWFTVLEGDGVELTIDGCCAQVTRGSAPIRFSGAAATGCRLLGGPTLDLNLMLRGAGGAMHVVAANVEWRPAFAQCGLFARVAGRCVAEGVGTDVPSRALLWFERAPATLSFAADRRGPSPSGWWLEADGGDGR